MPTVVYFMVPHGEDALAWAALAAIDVTPSTPPMFVERREAGDLYLFEIVNN